MNGHQQADPVLDQKFRLVVKELAVERGLRRIVSDVSFSLDEGDCLVLTGQNGTGKSTLLRAITGLHPIAAGKILLEGAGEIPHPEFCHYLGHKNGFKLALTVRENLEFWQRFCGAPELTIEEALDELDLSHTIDLPYSYLSAGQRRRAAIARLLISDRPIWVLDEPTTGFDQAATDKFDALATAFCQSGGILIAATHLTLSLPKAKHMEIGHDGKVTSK